MSKPLKTRTRVQEYGLTPPAGPPRKVIEPVIFQLAWTYPHEAAPVREVELAQMRATQPSVINSSIRRHLRKPQPGHHGDTYPLLVIWRGVSYIWDGHHRLCVALSRGATHAKARVIDLDDPYVWDLLRADIKIGQEQSHAYTLALDEIQRVHGSWFAPDFSPAAQAAFDAAYAEDERVREARRAWLVACLTRYYRPTDSPHRAENAQRGINQ